MLLFLDLPFALVLGLFLADKERGERVETELLERERRARAQALQSQLHPHVLFNVLAGLTELVHEDPDAAEEALVGLSELLRMLMRQGAAIALPLAQERSLIQRYLEIEAIRLGDRLQVEWHWSPELDGLPAPPLLLQPLVENAIKHGISPNPAGGTLRIDGLKMGGGFLLRVANTGAPLGAGHREGTGLGNLRERMALLPAPRPSLDLRQEGDWTVAELRVEATVGA
jgi:sensor histidine kinase YesM